MFTALFLVLVCLGIDFLFSAGVVWLLCWLLPAIGIASIGSFAIVFSSFRNYFSAYYNIVSHLSIPLT